MLIGMGCGALLGVLYCLASREGGPRDGGRASEEFKGMAEFTAIVAVLGGVAGATLRSAGWAMFVGGIFGAIAVGICGIVVTHHLKGLIFAFIGAPLGAILVYLYGIGHQTAKPSDKARVSPAQSGFWDGELDR
jgi:hypothetical protein